MPVKFDSPELFLVSSAIRAEIGEELTGRAMGLPIGELRADPVPVWADPDLDRYRE